jgi:hypothetical protein
MGTFSSAPTAAGAPNTSHWFTGMFSLTGVALPLVKEGLLGDVWLRHHEVVGRQRQRQALHHLPGTHAVAQLQPGWLLEGLQACDLGQHLQGANQHSV